VDREIKRLLIHRRPSGRIPEEGREGTIFWGGGGGKLTYALDGRKELLHTAGATSKQTKKTPPPRESSLREKDVPLLKGGGGAKKNLGFRGEDRSPAHRRKAAGSIVLKRRTQNEEPGYSILCQKSR